MPRPQGRRVYNHIGEQRRPFWKDPLRQSTQKISVRFVPPNTDASSVAPVMAFQSGRADLTCLSPPRETAGADTQEHLESQLHSDGQAACVEEDEFDPYDVFLLPEPLSRSQSPILEPSDEVDSNILPTSCGIETEALAENELTISLNENPISSRPTTANSEPQIIDNGETGAPIESGDAFAVMLGIWADAFQITRTQWKALVEILQTAPTLQLVHSLPLSLTTIKKYRKHLPLANIHGTCKFLL